MNPSPRPGRTAAEPSVVEQVMELLCFYLPGFEARLRAERTRRVVDPPRNEPRRRPFREQPFREPQEPPRDRETAACYAELEIPYGADLVHVRTAWRRLVRELHPDRCRDDPDLLRSHGERIRRVNRAYGELRRRLWRCG